MSGNRSAPATQRRRRLLAISHPAVVNVNQEVYRELQHRGWEVTIVVPSRWRSEYSQLTMTPQPLAGLEHALRPTPVALAGRPQRHFYLTRCRALSAGARPDVAFVEAEPYSVSATQWGQVFTQAGHPVRRTVRREHRPAAALAGARAAFASAAPRGVRGRPLGQRRTAGARLGGKRGGHARTACRARVGVDAAPWGNRTPAVGQCRPLGR